MQPASDHPTTATALGLAADGLAVEAGAGQYQQLRIRVDVFDESIVLTRYEQGKPISCYEVAPLDLAAALSGLPVASGLLPRDCLFYARHGGEQIAIYLPPRRRLLTVSDPQRRVQNIPLPGLVFVGQGTDYWIFAVKQRPGERERLFHAPFPNVHSDGRICPGGVSFPICSAQTIQNAAAPFFNSEFNGDLARGKSRRHEDILDLWAEIEDQESYPVDDLVKTSRVLADLWEGR